MHQYAGSVGQLLHCMNLLQTLKDEQFKTWRYGKVIRRESDYAQFVHFSMRWWIERENLFNGLHMDVDSGAVISCTSLSLESLNALLTILLPIVRAISEEDTHSCGPLLGQDARSLSAASVASSITMEPNSSNGTRNDGRIESSSSTELPQDLRSNAILLAQGHKAAMRRSFSLFTALGLDFSITNS